MKNLPISRFLNFTLFILFFKLLAFPTTLSASGHFPDKQDVGKEGTEITLYCATPTWLETSNITSTSATFSWDAISGAQTYSVQTRVLNGTWYNVPGSPTSNTWITVDWFLPNTTYEWRVKTNCYNGESSYWSNPVQFTTQGYGMCQAPAWLFTNNITQTSATLDWEPVSGAYSYTVQYRTVGGAWYDVPGGPFTETWVNLYGLSPCTNYQWRVKTLCNNWMYSDWSYVADFTTDCNYCNHPYWLYTSNLNFTSARLNWDYVPGAWSYTVQFRQVGGTWYELPGSPFEETWVTVTGLEPTTCYEWRVRSNCSNWTYSDWSYPQVFCTPGYSCHAPTWPSTWDITEHSATLNWSPVSGAYHYVVEIRQGNGEWYEVAGSPTNYPWITVQGLQSCTSYQWRVKAHCHDGDYSYWSETAWFTTQCEYYCHAPHYLTTTNVTTNSATLEWSSVPGAYSYSIQYRVSGGNWEFVTGGPFTGTWTTIYGLQPGTTYEWRVRTNCSNWTYSQWSYPAWFTTLGGCSRPSFLFTEDITTTTATLDWSSVVGAWSYEVQIREANSGTWTNVDGSPFTETIAHVTGLTPGTTYLWRVKTNCEDGYSSLWTKPATFTTIGIPTCDAPYWVFTTDITETGAKLDWAHVNNAESYTIQFREPGQDWADLPTGLWTETWYTVTGLSSGTTYEWRVRSNCPDGLYSDWSQTAVFKTLGPSCHVPTVPWTSDITDTSAILHWNAAAGAALYELRMRVPYGIWNEVVGSPVADVQLLVSDLIPGTIYEWQVRTICNNGHHSDWTDIVEFATTGAAIGGSDECDGATALTVNNYCNPMASSNEGATESFPPPMGWCPENEYNDVWFRFTMPDIPNPVVTIRTMAGTLTDGIMEIYRGADCNSLSYLFCEDDNSFHNSSTMPVVTISGYQNETIWVRVWGYAGTTGSFGICVFDFASNDLVAPDATDEIMDGAVINESVIAKQINEAKDIATSLRISPNPSRDVVNIRMNGVSSTSVSRLDVFDVSGQLVLTRDYINTSAVMFEETLDVTDLTEGMYLIQITTSNGVMTGKLSVMN